MRVTIILLFLIQCCYGFNHNLNKAKLPPIEVSTQLTAQLQQTANYLNNKTQSTRPFKIQFYGQSIVAGMDMQSVEKRLKNDFPDVKFQLLNNAIGGYQANLIKETAYHDLYPAHPDLLIFHVYGGTKTGELEELFCEITSRLTSDVLIFDHHISYVEGSLKQQDHIKYQDEESSTIKNLADKYGFGFINVRQYWKDFLTLNPDYTIKSLLRDDVHPNEEGNALLEYILFESLQKAVKRNGRNKSTVVHNSLLKIKNNKEILFTGNKVVLKPNKGAVGSTFKVLIDGKEPHQLAEAYTVTRPSSVPGQWWPAINRIYLNREMTQFPEKWKVNFSDIDWIKMTYKFDVVGDNSGPQGNGVNGQDFTSKNGLISFKQKDVTLFLIRERAEEFKEVTIEFEVKNQFKNPIHLKDDQEVTLFQSSRNTEHVLKLIPIEGSLQQTQMMVHTPQESSCND
ncbi:SGNH/GDSL hydrolase family protein [Nonlabens antarcticus]|uniref:SGNH/GDSL hydrolase family protein n=1 Tax=Nonlabens antarcticus TaxID=392714 RepID=UPI0018914739|nr:SGNH/GDSL hydrolase family protein [Nonlabens antarcticus]